MPFFVGTFIGMCIIGCVGFTRRDWLADLTIAVVFIGFPFVLLISWDLLIYLHPFTVDPWLYQADRTLGIDDFSFIHFTYAHPALVWVLSAVYYGLPVILALAWAIERSTLLLRSAVIAPVAAFLFYNLVPAVGPVHALAWDAPHTLLSNTTFDHIPRNCFPSMHFGWALLVALNAKSWPWRTFTWLFVLLTAMATTGSGEHYFVDLIAAVPLCLAVQILSERTWP